jgi:hypothetical protein
VWLGQYPQLLLISRGGEQKKFASIDFAKKVSVKKQGSVLCFCALFVPNEALNQFPFLQKYSGTPRVPMNI